MQELTDLGDGIVADIQYRHYGDTNSKIEIPEAFAHYREQLDLVTNWQQTSVWVIFDRFNKMVSERDPGKRFMVDSMSQEDVLFNDWLRHLKIPSIISVDRITFLEHRYDHSAVTLNNAQIANLGRALKYIEDLSKQELPFAPADNDDFPF